MLAFALCSSLNAFANKGDYANWGPEPTKPEPPRAGSGTACGPWDINDYGSHPEGKTAVTIFTKIKPRPELGYLYVEMDSAYAHQYSQINNGRCVCLDYTWSSAPVPGIATMTEWDFQPASEFRECPPPGRGHARPSRRRH